MARGFERAGYGLAVCVCHGYAYERGNGPERNVAGYLTVGFVRWLA